ncbi:MFS general substrate transporter [Auriculariales sp. MPI-PUGE-AT-0066]|nr:MFS general substrate transporter [Auriculariales sp. MPI-PUGE-AT-0066]
MSSTTATPLPWAQLSLLWLVQLAEPITSTIIFPFIPQLIMELGVTDDPAKTGYFVGWIESLFFITQAMCVLHWGRLGDRIGRRPILIIGLSGLALSQVCFGLASGRHGSFIGLILSRAVAGALNGNAGAIKSAIAELTDETNAPQAFSFINIVWNTGAAIGPFLGGMLAHPYERFPNSVFGKFTFFQEYPYFAPCAAAAALAVLGGTVTALFFREPVVAQKGFGSSSAKTDPPTEDRPAAQDLVTETTPLLVGQSAEMTTPVSRQPPAVRDILTPRLLAVIRAYGFLSMVDISNMALLPLFLSSPARAGGLGLTPSVIGMCIGVGGAVNAVTQAIAYPRLHRRFGPKAIFITGSLAFCVVWPLWIATWCLATTLTSTSVDGLWRSTPGALWVWMMIAAIFLLTTVSEFCFACAFMFITDAVPRNALGTANGLAQTCTSIMRAIGPALMTSLWSWSAGWLYETDPGVHFAMQVFGNGPKFVVAGIAVPVQALAVYLAMETSSIGLVWTATKLIEGKEPDRSSSPPKRSDRDLEVEV